MPAFKYTGYDKNGKTVKGVKESLSKQVLLTELNISGLFVDEITEVKTGGSFLSKIIKPSKNLSDYFFQLSLLMNSGIPLVSAHNIIAKNIRSQKERLIILETASKISEGIKFSDALALHGDYYEPMYINLIKAAEMVGTLPQVMMDIADYEENKKKNMDNLKSALIYPVTILILGMGILSFLLTVIVPKIEKIFSTSKQELPTATKILLSVSSFTKSYAALIFITILTVTIICLYFYRNNSKFKLSVDKRIFSINFAANAFIARFSHVLAFQLKEGMPLSEALLYAGNTVSNIYMKNNIMNIRKSIQEGIKFSNAVKDSGIFPDIFPAAVSTGETSGNLSGLLERVAIYYNRQSGKYTDSFLSIIEPLSIVILGGLVGFIVIAIMLPLFDINTLIN